MHQSAWYSDKPNPQQEKLIQFSYPQRRVITALRKQGALAQESRRKPSFLHSNQYEDARFYNRQPNDPLKAALELFGAIKRLTT